MKIAISFEELTDIVGSKAKTQVGIEYVAADTFKVTKEVKIPFIKVTKRIGMNITVIGFSGHDLIVKDPSNLVSNLLSLADGLDIKSIATIRDGKIAIHLDNIERVAKAFEHFEPKGVNFSDEGVVLSADIKL